MCVIGPEPDRAWPSNYGLWLDDAEQLGMLELIGQRWARTEVVLAGRTIDLGRGYARLDNARLQAHLRERSSIRVLDDRVERIEHEADASVVISAKGPPLLARLVVDATGHGSCFVARERGPAPGYQVAWGELRRLPVSDRSALMPATTMRFMDWTPHGPTHDDLPPSFLYCMPIDEQRIFVEETVLVGRPPGDPSEWLEPLRERLHARLADSALAAAELVEVERCIIPMGGPLPMLDQRTLAFGGAASFVHPATGYMLTQVLRRKDRVADTIASVLAEPRSPSQAAHEVWRAIWTTAEIRAWRLFGFGMEVLLELDRAGIEQFFGEFFALPEPRWRGFLSASAPASSLMATMLRYFASAPLALQRRLAAHLFGREGWRMARGFSRSQRAV